MLAEPVMPAGTSKNEQAQLPRLVVGGRESGEWPLVTQRTAARIRKNQPVRPARLQTGGIELPKEPFAIGPLSGNKPSPHMQQRDFSQRLMERCLQQDAIVAHRRQEMRDESAIPAFDRRCCVTERQE